MQKWLQSDMSESRGRPKLGIDVRQKIYDTWIDNATPSTDNRNNRCEVKISEQEYLEKYSGL